MKWEVVDDCIEAKSRYTDEGTPFKWWIIENSKVKACVLGASKELLEANVHFNSVLEAMAWADKEDEC